MKQKKLSKLSRKKIISISLLAAIVVAGSYVAAAYYNKWLPFSDQDKAFTVDDQGRGVNPNKTKTEKKDTKNVEDNPDNKSARPNTDVTPQPKTDPQTKKQSVYVLMTSVEQSVDKHTITASGFVTNAVEQDGTCTYVFTLGNRVVKKTAGVIPGPSSTSCQTMRVSRDELGAAGKWTVSIEYNSGRSHGVADGMTVVVE
ncbi:hypothetical protein V4210_04290 [Candidatus Nanosynbacter sp. BB002]|jgi:hypothetical protein|uniref:hypothetical protein n=1 Tax=Candidatus Nanosynbacter sp. BB002 TaxID=3393757 RepID=UPI0030D55E1C